MNNEQARSRSLLSRALLSRALLSRALLCFALQMIETLTERNVQLEQQLIDMAAQHASVTSQPADPGRQSLMEGGSLMETGSFMDLMRIQDDDYCADWRDIEPAKLTPFNQ